MSSNTTFFQFQPDLELPIYIQVDLGSFHPELEDFLNVRGFIKMGEEDQGKVFKELEKTLSGRVLTLKKAVPSVAKQITGVIEADQFGEESIIPKSGYRVYRYKNHGLLVYSFAAIEWELGCFESFGAKNSQFESNTVINRFLSWSLSSHGIVGFWGSINDGYMTVQKKNESNGEVVFLDIRNRNVIDKNGVTTTPSEFAFVRLNKNLKKNMQMSPENLLGFLSSRCSYLDHQGLSVPIRQLLQQVVKEYSGYEAAFDLASQSSDLSPS
jgi:hypothetical protein